MHLLTRFFIKMHLYDHIRSMQSHNKILSTKIIKVKKKKEILRDLVKNLFKDLNAWLHHCINAVCFVIVNMFISFSRALTLKKDTIQKTA